MKRLALITSIISGLILSACGPMSSNPMEAYDMSKTVPVGTPQNPQVITVTETIPVEEIVAQGEIFTIEHSPNISFTEGKPSEYDFTVKINKSKMKFDIVDMGLPDGAKITYGPKEMNKRTFKLSFNPKTGSVPATVTEVIASFQIELKNFEFDSSIPQKEKDETVTILNAISKVRDVEYIVRRTKDIPTLEVIGLKNGENRKEGEKHAFQVKITAPGTSLENPPILAKGYDAAHSMTSKGLESDGSLYVVEDPDHKNATLENGVWTFYFLFDTTKNIAIQQDKNRKPVIDATQLLVNLTFQAGINGGASSDLIPLRFAIDYIKKDTTQTPSPVPAGTGG